MAKALVLFHSQEFMNTAQMAEAVAEGLRAAACEVDLFNSVRVRARVINAPEGPVG